MDAFLKKQVRSRCSEAACVLFLLVLTSSTISLVCAKPLLLDGEIDVEVPESGCFSPESNRTYGVGEKWATGPPFMCAMIQCTGNNAFSALPCATYISPDWCVEEPGDESAVYPDCCPRTRCPESSTDSDIIITPKPTEAIWDAAEEASNTIP